MAHRYYVSFQYEADPNTIAADVPLVGTAAMIVDLDIVVDTPEAVARLTLVLMQTEHLANCVVLGVIPLKMPLIVTPGPAIVGPHGNVLGQARPEGLI